MQKLADISKIALRVVLATSIAAVAVFVCLRLHQASSIEASVQRALDAVNADCDKLGVGGTICMANTELLKTGNVLDRSAYVVKKEQMYLDDALPELTRQVAVTLGEIDRTAARLDDASAAVRPLLTSVTARVDALQPIETNLADVTDAGTKTVRDADALVTSEDVTDAVHGASKASLFFAESSEHVAEATVHVDSMLGTADAVEQELADPFLHPRPKHWWNYIKPSWQVIWQGAMLAK